MSCEIDMGKKSKKGNKNVSGKAKNGNSPRKYDNDTIVFISMSHELKDEGTKLFQRRDYEGAILKYEKAIKLLPGNHIDVPYLRSNLAACYMQMGLVEYPRAIHECNLALEVTPKYSKALLKRARCYEALNRLEFALRDVSAVLNMEPNNVMAIEIAERVKTAIDERGAYLNGIPIDVVPVSESVETPVSSSLTKQKNRKKRSGKIKGDEHFEIIEGKKEDSMPEDKMTVDRIDVIESTEIMFKGNMEENIIQKGDGKIIEYETEKTVTHRTEEIIDLKNPGNLGMVEMNHDIDGKNIDGEHWLEDKMPDENKVEDFLEDKKTEDKLMVEEKIANATDDGPRRTLKLVYGEDIRLAQVPLNCTILRLREIIQDRFPNCGAFLIKYRDQEGDLVTITSNEELRWAEASVGHSSVRLYIFEVNPAQDPFFQIDAKHCKKLLNKPCCVEDWIVDFAYRFKDYVGFESDSYLDLHEVGMKLYSEAMEEIVTSEEAQDLFGYATKRFQEMAALALFNCGNVHMSRARKRVYLKEDHSQESVLEQIRNAYVWAQDEYSKAGMRYEEALKIKKDFYEAVLALGQQQFEQAKLSWYYAIATDVDLESWPSLEVLHLYNNAEENMERGMQMWQEVEEQRLTELSRVTKSKALLKKMKLEEFLRDLSADEAAQQVVSMRSQINLLWGTLLYERSLMEFKLGVPVWHECLEFAVEKFELAGASPTDIAVMIKNHYSNDAAIKGPGFNIDEIVQAWNEMYQAKRWQSGIPSFRLEPLLRRRVSKIYDALEHR